MNDTSRAFNTPLFALGFRPFFLFSAFQSVLVMALWILFQAGKLPEFTGINVFIWHIHEMVFGFAGGMIAGFILTASANWVGIRGLHGWKLFGLFTSWLVGRIVFILVPFNILSAHWLILDLFWMPLLLLALAPPLIRAGKWRNTGLLFILLGLFICQIMITLHLLGFQGSILFEAAYISPFFIILLIMIVGGRITPIFTRNKYQVEVLKRPLWDWASILSLYVFLVLLLVFGWGKTAGWAALAVAISNLIRMSGWKSFATWKDPIYWVMHLAYAFIPLGFTVLWLALSFNLVSRSIAIHVFNTGVIGLFILGMITRVTKGHTGRPIQSDLITTTAYFLLLGSIVFRTVVPFIWPAWYLNSIMVSGLTWILAFVFYLVRYTRFLISPRPDGKPG